MCSFKNNDIYKKIRGKNACMFIQYVHSKQSENTKENIYLSRLSELGD